MRRTSSRSPATRSTGHPASVYRRLLHHAGCELGDLERLVRRDGLERALRQLLAQGVHLTVDEAKGRQPVVRGSLTVAPEPDMLTNPLAARHVPVATSGSRGARTVLLMDVAFVRDQGVNMCLAVDAAGGGGLGQGRVGGPGRLRALPHPQAQQLRATRIARWFTQVDPSSRDLHPRYRWSHRLVRVGEHRRGRAVAGPHATRRSTILFPSPAGWPARSAAARTPWIRTFPSSAVRACQAALDAGIELDGARFTIAGEPVTDAKLDAIRRSGAQSHDPATARSRRAPGVGMSGAAGPDDMHVFHDLHAIVQPATAPCCS